jgi:hypothetical protein
MTLLILFLAASVFSAILVVAAGMLSSRATRDAEVVETYAQDHRLGAAGRVPKEMAEALD